MNYNPSTMQEPQKKDYRKLIYSLFILALIGTWGYIIYDKNKSIVTVQHLQENVTTAETTKDALQKEFNETSAKLDSLNSNHIKLKGNLAEKNKQLQTLKANIASILKKKNASDAELANAKKMIEELNGKITDLYAEVEKLKTQNQELTVSNNQLTTEKSQLQDTLVKTVALKDNITDLASTLHASNISIEAIKLRSNGKEKETTTAKRADLLRIGFEIDQNRIAASGNKELYVCIVAPDGTAISNGETVATREDGEKAYASKLDVNYEQGKSQIVTFDWKNTEGKYQPGQYKVSIYQNGFKIGESYISLKKGGLFS